MASVLKKDGSEKLKAEKSPSLWEEFRVGVFTDQLESEMIKKLEKRKEREEVRSM
jgi:hypothetical protein